MNNKNESEIEKIVDDLRKYSHLYYTGNSTLSDADFDQLESRVRQIEPAHPYFSELGTCISDAKIQHRVPMLSLGKAKNMEEAEKWLKGLNHVEDTRFAVQPKVDGLSASLFYFNGSLRHVATRGNGRVGQDVSHIARYIDDIPFRIKFTKLPVEIRGELHLPCDTKYPTGGKPLRNNCVGLINRKENREDLVHVRFLAYQILWHVDLPLGASLADAEVLKLEPQMAFESGKIHILEREGFYMFKPYIIDSRFSEYDDYFLESDEENQARSVEEDRSESEDTSHKTLHIEELAKRLEEYYRKYNESLRSEWNFETDGLVLMVDRCELHQMIDKQRVIDHHHHYALALKAPSQHVQTNLRQIVWQVSRHGTLIPVAVFEARFLAGVRLERASLHNADNVRQLKLALGDTIIVERSNDVIPYVRENLSSQNSDRNESEPEIWPEKCPSCGHSLIKQSVNLCCSNPRCKDRTVQEILFWVRERGIDQVAQKTIEALYEAGKIKGIQELYTLIEADFENLEGFGLKKITNLLKQVELSRRMSITQFIAALGIPMVQQKSLLMLNICSMEDFMNFNNPEYAAGRSLIAWKANEANFSLLKNIAAELHIHNEEKKKQDLGQICLTGNAPMGRKALTEELQKKGWKVTSSVTGKTTLLLCEDTAGNSSKLEKARSLGIPIHTYADYDLININDI